ncbi:MAG TPA: hypothetical protein VMI75_14245 [Polyangiaceae bacterium]|nr:hypothetical protein [Polyangiaceae bacterium]
MGSIDFTDEDAVLEEVAKAIDYPVEDLSIQSARNLEGFGAGDVYEITTHGGRKEWYVVEDSDVERDLAIAIVTQDLETEPEIFNQSFLESHIDTDRLRRDLMSDVLDMRIEDLTDEAERRPDDFWRAYEGEGFDAPEEDEEGERREPTSSEIEELAEKLAEEQLKDPIAWLEDIYGREDAIKKAIEIAGIDIDAAAEEAVDTDGPGHFLSSYDGQTHETPAGLVYWRHN